MPYVRAILIAVATAVGPFVVAHVVLENHAEQRGQAELRSVAERYVQRAELVISEAVGALRLLHRRDTLNCLDESRRAFIDAVRQSTFIESIGLVDRRGLTMCVEPIGKRAGATLLPPYRQDAPVIALGIVEDARASRAAVIGWSVSEDVRLVARLEPGALDIEPGPANLHDRMRGVVTLRDGGIWRAEGISIADANERWLSATSSSSRYPVEAVVSAPWSAIWAPILPLHQVVIASAIAFGFVVLIVSLRITWRMYFNSHRELLEGILNNEFVPYYQPVIDIDRGCLRGCEVLVRWRRPDGSLVYPGAFMPYAEASGYVIELTRQVMRRARDDLGEFYSRNPDLKMSINLAARHFEDRRIVEDIEEIFGDGPIAYDQLVFEVTERQPLSDIDFARKIIAELHAHGIRVALDDVGTGHSGLAYLQKLGVDIVKIDKMFIDTLLSDQNAHAIVDTLIELACSLNMGIIAEGVESEEQITKLREMGVTAAQGFLFSPALPAKMFIELARRMSGASLSGKGGADAVDQSGKAKADKAVLADVA